MCSNLYLKLITTSRLMDQTFKHFTTSLDEQKKPFGFLFPGLVPEIRSSSLNFHLTLLAACFMIGKLQHNTHTHEAANQNISHGSFNLKLSKQEALKNAVQRQQYSFPQTCPTGEEPSCGLWSLDFSCNNVMQKHFHKIKKQNLTAEL